ncbi:E3 ubiquitin-protein ligase TRIM9-like [Tropilaelaps mercedesae]|uniref:E3 ubiquitin-protein ligase TRIM9-like n=1 Tax=Tropilaelaps mercedesae TaxID=418985 RepID=A0A1V9X374_9ACAR|nr:E3 ubiquitin-protein ligase TRIM9-like [Tropilaelaps mercedesae]
MAGTIYKSSCSIREKIRANGRAIRSEQHKWVRHPDSSGGGRLTDSARLSEHRRWTTEDIALETVWRGSDLAPFSRHIFPGDIPKSPRGFARPKGEVESGEGAKAKLVERTRAERQCGGPQARGVRARPTDAVERRRNTRQSRRVKTTVTGEDAGQRRRQYRLGPLRKAQTEERSTRAAAFGITDSSKYRINKHRSKAHIGHTIRVSVPPSRIVVRPKLDAGGFDAARRQRRRHERNSSKTWARPSAGNFTWKFHRLNGRQWSVMEAELKCTVCKHLFVNPVILPCFHSVCLKCAVQLQQPASNSQEDDFDQLSLVSETDSGVVCSPLPSGNSLAITCPTCHKSCLFDENGAGNLCKNRALANIIDRYSESRKLHIECQMCEPGTESSGGNAQAAWFCEQCEVFYCEPCLGAFHPQRGPLAAHQLITAIQGRSQQRAKFKISAVKEMNCLEHEDNPFSMFCLMCKIPLCVMCLHDGRHATHDVQALGQMCRLQKIERVAVSRYGRTDRSDVVICHMINDAPRSSEQSAERLSGGP